MHFTALRKGLAIAILLTAAGTTRGAAQTATPEGTVITNTAIANYTDANNNTYAPDSASVSLTVGFAAGIDTKSPVTVTPASPSSGDTILFTVVNTGNGRDSVSLAFSAGTGVTLTGYRFNGTTYSTLAGLDSALAGAGIAAGDSIAIQLIYSVASGKGGQTVIVTGTATSLRTPAVSDPSSTNVSPPGVAAVTVTTTPASVDRLPSNGTQYSQTFHIVNNGNTSDTYNLSSGNGAATTIVSVNGTAGTSSTVTIASGGSADVIVVYTVGSAAAGTTSTVGLSATSQADASKNDAASVTVTVIRPAINITKVAYMDDTATVISADSTVKPGQYILYKIKVSNTGTASADSIVVRDSIPAELTYDSAFAGTGTWTITETGGAVTARLTGTLAKTEERFFWIRARVK